MRTRTVILVVIVAIVAAVLYVAATSPSDVGGSSTYHGHLGTMSRVVVSQTAWRHKGQIRRIGHHVKMTKLDRTRSTRVGPCYRVDAEVHGDSWAIDKVVQGFGHFKICMKASDHTKILDKYSYASESHRETWLWWVGHVDLTSGQGVSTKWCNGGVGPCLPVDYRYWRYTFQWKDGVSIGGQDFAHHKTLYIGCTLRAGGAGFHCGTGEA